MPHVAIAMIPGRDKAAKQALGVDPGVVSVSVQDIPAEAWPQFMKQLAGDVLFVKPGTQGASQGNSSQRFCPP